MNCKRCNCDQIAKNGKVNKKQRYYCKKCGFNFTEGDRRKERNADKKRRAISLYLDNMGFRAIGRALDVNNVTVLNWIREAGKEIEAYHKQKQEEAKNGVKQEAIAINGGEQEQEEQAINEGKEEQEKSISGPEQEALIKSQEKQEESAVKEGSKKQEPLGHIELDELWHYVGKKKNKLWVWLALHGDKFAMLDFVVGDRSAETGKKLWIKISEIDCKAYHTDDWPAYREFIEKEKHVVGKQGTNRIESFNSNIRHYLARFRRKTKCYSKSAEMVVLSLYLLMYKDLALSIF